MVAKDKFTVFPNPVKSVLYIKPNDVKEYYYQIYNMSGQLVKSGKFENEKTDLSSLISGAYLMRINNSEVLVKIIKE
ncbi:T9SS type A sorting domain-containing protein [Chryseobacterium carnipullorum]|uniref:T9SS type A sorting domain-containing protein n=1 Tax=Chryseobacterium carnipullorum TaxID=1124835 RepID=UPI0037423342